jgi:hypothetical protein
MHDTKNREGQDSARVIKSNPPTLNLHQFDFGSKNAAKLYHKAQIKQWMLTRIKFVLGCHGGWKA